MRLALPLASALLPTLLAAQVRLTWVSQPPPRIEAAQCIEFRWRASQQAVTRYRILLPQQILYGIRSYSQAWTSWGPPAQVSYCDFIDDGKYTFEVEARLGSGKATTLKAEFEVAFVSPEVWDDGVRIDWGAALALPDKRSRYRKLAEEFEAQAVVWQREYESEYRLLKATSSPQEVAEMFVAPLKDKFVVDPVLSEATTSRTVGVKKLLDYKVIYDILKQAGVSGFLVVRNIKTNRAMFSMLSARLAGAAYRRLAETTPAGYVLRYRPTAMPISFLEEVDLSTNTETAGNRVTTRTQSSGRQRLALAAELGDRMRVDRSYEAYEGTLHISAPPLVDETSALTMKDAPAATVFTMSSDGRAAAGSAELRGGAFLPQLPAGEVPLGYSWKQTYPSPGGGSTTFTFTIRKQAIVAGRPAVEIALLGDVNTTLVAGTGGARVDGDSRGTIEGVLWFLHEDGEYGGMEYRMALLTSGVASGTRISSKVEGTVRVTRR